MITHVPDWQDSSDQECLDWLLAVDTKPSNRGRLTHEWVSENISLAVADAVFAAISEVSPPSAQRYNVGNGIDTTAELWKQQAEAVAVAVPSLAPHLTKLRDFELVTGPRWQLFGISFEPTADEIAKSRIIETARQQIRDEVARLNRIKAWIDQLDTAEMTVQEVDDYVSAIMASDDGNPPDEGDA